MSDETMNEDTMGAMSHRSSPFLWGVTDGAAGQLSQVEGVLEAAGLPYAMKTARRAVPWAWLPVWAWRGALRQLTPDSDALAAPWPEAVVSSGRRAAAVALAVKAASGGRTKLIHLTDPRGCRARFDLIVAMQHDAAEGPNVMKTKFALHRVTARRLQEAAALWQPRFAHLPGPYAAVLIGGSTNKYTLSGAAMERLIARLKALLAAWPGSLLITASRRTGEANRRRLCEAFEDEGRAFVYRHGENPYLGMLALAEAVIVTDDSVNMLSEACSTGKPVHVLRLPEHTHTKPARFAGALVAQGIARELALPPARWEYRVEDEMSRVAEAVRSMLGMGH